ncbi:hypothetical protein G7077_11335 [Sphingomonas piscis]|uniref:Uncharacterized protein n=1 Tax=Sphingomonas piscis TaxID=2714943 RepID=A0A6G7YRN9_9SPHN|nr:YdbH domain-containing protein [Sphingomonas piscis]QIK79407.1 hypothetical protein G7077_11335 [Sphingomonas piscis]
MAERQSENEVAGGENRVAIRRGRRWPRMLSIVAVGLLALLVAALVAVWMARRPLATRVLAREFDRRGVQATYRLDRVGLRTQQVSNLVIGDPKRPDLVARYALVQLRVKWNGSVEVYRIVARGVRLRGRLVGGKVSWGQIDKLMPPPSGKPFALPDFTVDVADTSISLGTPFGAVGFALEGVGNLTGGFKGRAAVRSPLLIPGRCQVQNLSANFAVEVTARKPHVIGPLAAQRLNCPSSRFDIADPRFEVDSGFNESFTNFDGRGRMAIRTLTAGENGLAAFTGDLTFRGDLDSIQGQVKLSARQSRVAAIYADRTRLAGNYRLGYRTGSFVMAGDYAAQSSTLDPSMVAGITGPINAVASTPVGPIAKTMGDAIQATIRNFDATGRFRMVNFPGGGAVRVDSANVLARTGARASVSGGAGITYYWPGSKFRIDTAIATQGGGLPTARLVMRQPYSGAPLRGFAEMAPYTSGSARLELAPVRFNAAADGSTRVTTVVQLTGPFAEGRVEALRVPVDGRVGQGGSFAVGTGCAVVSFNALRMSALQLGPTRLPVCPVGNAILAKAPDGPLRIGARINGPSLAGRLGSSPLRVAATRGQIIDRRFDLFGLAARLGQSESPIIFDAARLGGSFAGSGISGTFSGAKSTIGNVPLAMSDIAGTWRVYNGDLTAKGGLLVSDRAPDPRFTPMRSDDFNFSLANNRVRAFGGLGLPSRGVRIANVDIEHDLNRDAGYANLDVPGLTFGDQLQPEEITRLTQGVIALVQGTVRGRGRIDWTGSGNVTSSGDFTTADLSFAAPFGPVTGVAGTIHFDDLLGLSTPPGQVMTVQSINPGVLVENGVIRYQLLPDQLVKIERGEWPFMGGRLILRETILNFGRPSAKRLTFEVVGLDAKTFVDTLGFSQIEATGVFDGVLPMIFDESGGRIVGGRLDARPPGGTLAYVTDIPNLGFAQKIAFDAIRSLRFRSMIIRLDGDLAGEFAARLSIDGVALGQSNRTQQIVRSLLSKVPVKLNVNITGPFRALIATAKSISDPRLVIGDVLPRPLEDVPGIVTEVRRREEEQTATTTTAPATTTPTNPPTRKEQRP